MHSRALTCSVLLAIGSMMPMAGAAGPSGRVHLRGPNYDGLTSPDGLDPPWPKNGPPLLWKRHLGQGFSGCIVVGNRVFTQAQKRSGQYVVCLDLVSGSQMWESRYDWPWQLDGKWPGPYATPTYAAGRVYFCGAHGLVGCVDAFDGRLYWSRNVLTELQGKGMHFGYACTPLVEFDTVYVPVGGTGAAVVALNASDGSIIWKSGEHSASYSSSIAVSFEGEPQILSFLQIALTGHDPRNGRELWRSLWGSGYNAHSAWPIYREPYVFRSTPFRRGCRVDRIVRKEEGFELEPVWQSRALCVDFLSPVLLGEYVYGFDVKSQQAARDGATPGEFVCLEFATGNVCWRTKATGHASVIGCGNKLVLLNEFGWLIVAEACPAEYRETARAAILTGQLCWTAPTLHGGCLLARGGQELVCVLIGPRALSAARAAAANSASRHAAGRAHWLDQYQRPDMWSPTLASLGAWYVFNTAGVLGLAWIVHLPFRSRKTLAFHLFLAFALVLAVAGLHVYTRIIGVFVFTWPTAMYVCFLWVLIVGAIARVRRIRAWRAAAYLALVCFALLCGAYYCACRNLFVIAGWGFLTGFVAAAPIMYRLAAQIVRGDAPRGRYLMVLLSYTVYFWMSGLVTIWRARSGSDIWEFWS